MNAYGDAYTHKYVRFYHSTWVYLSDKQIDNCISIRQLDRYEYMSVDKHIHIYEYSLGRAPRYFNKPTLEISEDPSCTLLSAGRVVLLAEHQSFQIIPEVAEIRVVIREACSQSISIRRCGIPAQCEQHCGPLSASVREHCIRLLLS